MDEQIKEQIKLKTEFLKFYFILFLGTTTGTLTLAVKEQFFSTFQLGLIYGGFAASVVILTLIVYVNRSIKTLIRKLL